MAHKAMNISTGLKVVTGISEGDEALAFTEKRAFCLKGGGDQEEL